MEQNKKTRIIAVIYYLALYLVWAVLECLIVPKLESQALPVSIDVIMEIGFKTLLWFIPAFLLIRRCGDSLFLPKSALLGEPKKAVTYLPLCVFLLLFTAWHLIPNIYQNGTLTFKPTFHAVDIIVSLSIGISEELVFRGLLLNTALKDRKLWLALSGNAVMFLLIHFPIWLREGVFMPYMTSFAFLQLIALSLIFGWTFVKSRSIVVPIILHAYWDLLCVALA